MTRTEDFYSSLIDKHREQLVKLNKKRALYGWLRFLSMACAITIIWLSWSGWLIAGIPLAIIFIALFFFILKKDLDNNDEIENVQRLIEINETEIRVLHHNYTDLFDGLRLKPEHHDYANDLDIFGRASLYQYVSRCQSEQGQKLMADWMLKPASVSEIKKRQSSIKEIAKEVEWRQQLQSFGMETSISTETELKLLKWLQEPIKFLDSKLWKALKYILPLISFTLLAIHIAGIIEGNIFYPAIILMMLMAFGISKQMIPVYSQLDKAAPQLETLYKSINWIENKKFESDQLKQLQQSFEHNNKQGSAIIKQLKKILDRFDIRLNPLVFIPLNTFLFWDIHQVLLLEKWKKENKDHIVKWFQTLEEFETISSLACLSFNQPTWAIPEISDEPGIFSATELGHPLIQKEKMVLNDFSSSGTSGLGLITGSNMAGKSTFLRSVGVNIVLAMMGSVVCATQMRTSHFKVLSSMRVSDNLEENTSTFYAELKKLKEIIESVYRKEDVFLLLDEILRGTNSTDRHTGSKALIKQLIEHNAVGLIATHDLELSKLSSEYPDLLHNYHFDVRVSGEELSFDYKLKKGICTSMNASLLMKKIGIEI